MNPAPEAANLRTWKADSWDDLHSIWNTLTPPPDPSSGKVVRAFGMRTLTPSEAGFVFERWLMEAFRLSGAHGAYSYNVPMPESRRAKEQIDGAVFDGWQGFVVEAKCWDDPVDFGPIALLHTKVQKRVGGPLGLFFSVSGYTEPALESAADLRPPLVLLFSLPDLIAIVNQRNMVETVRQKWRETLLFARPHLWAVPQVEFF
jgi:hypothetical protein